MFETRFRKLARDGVEVPGTSEVLARIGREGLLRAYRRVATVRALDAAELRLRKQGRVFFQLGSAGHEILQVAAALHLRPAHDWFYPYYRDRSLVLALGVGPADLLRQSMAKAGDPASGGRQMPCHFGFSPLNIVSQSSPTGTQFLQAVGTAQAGRLARRLGERGSFCPSRRDELVYVSAGEGATSEGEFHEALNAAALEKLPVIFVVEDNEYAISVPVEAQTAGGSISRLVSGVPGLRIEEVDGLDFVASWLAFERTVRHCRAGGGPALVHAHVVRLVPHSDSDDHGAYRRAEEREANVARDPLVALERLLEEEAGIPSSELAALRAGAEEEIRHAVEEVDAEAAPSPDSLERHLFAPASAADPAPPAAPAPPASSESPEPINLVEAINHTLATELEADARVVVFGEDVADLTRQGALGEIQGKGGVFKATRGLQRRFGSERVFNSPLAEAGVVGRAIGMALRGFVPVVEIQFLDFIWPAMNQIRSELALMRWRSAGHFSAPVVIRAAAGGYLRGGGIYHSQSAESIFASCPGLRVVMPSSARDAAGLLRAAIHCGDPVLFLEPKHLYRNPVARSSDPGPGFTLELGRAATLRPGRHATVVSWGTPVHASLRAASELAAEGKEAEVIDLRSLVPYDWEAIRESVARTGRLLVVHEESRSFGFGAEIAARAAGELFDLLDAPVARVGARHVPVAYSPVLEKAALPAPEEIREALRKTLAY